jgi:ABC-type transport system involved in multi-copper enzyme maturation permease subunit
VIVQDPTLAIAPAVTRDMVTALLDGVAGGGIAYQTIAARQAASGLTPDPAGLPGLLEAYASWYAPFQRALFHSPDTAALSLVAPAVGGQAGNALQTVMGLMMAGQLVFFSFFTGGYAMMTLLEEQEDGTLGRLFTTPTGRTTILAGKFLAAFITVLAQGLVLLIAGHFAFGINWGDPAAAALTLLGQMLASVGLAAVLVSLVKTSKQAGPVINAVLTGLGMLSGLFTTNIQMPAAFNALGNFTPQGWVLKAWRLTLAGQPVSELWLPFGVLAATGLVLFLIGAALFRRRFA